MAQQRRRLLAVGVAAAIVTPAVTATAASRSLPGGFVPYRSVGGVRLGESRQTVLKQLGSPHADNGNQIEYVQAHPRQQLLVTFDSHRRGEPVASIQANGARLDTKHGLGVGSSRAQIRRRYPHFQCNSVACTGRHGALFMEFDFGHGRVDGIDLGDLKLRRG